MTAPLIKIRIVEGHGFIFSLEDLKLLRERYQILGCLTGILSNFPQQNLFMGLPLELMPEDVMFLLESGVAELIDEKKSIHNLLSNIQDDEMKEIEADQQLDCENQFKISAQIAWNNRVKAFRQKNQTLTDDDEKAFLELMRKSSNTYTPHTKFTGKQLFSDSAKYEISTTSYIHPSPESYAMYSYLQTNKFYVSPGIRFGGQFVAYPGDSLRYHSHHIATGLGWSQKFPTMQIIGGGRLATSVKKCIVFGAHQPSISSDSESSTDTSGRYRAFSIEWAGFG